MFDAVCNAFIKRMYRLGPDVSTGFCGLHYVSSQMRRFAASLIERITRLVAKLRRNPPIVVPLTLGAVLYSVFHRTTQEFLAESAPIAAFLVFIAYSFFIMRWSLFGRPKFNIHLVLLPILYLPILSVLVTVIYWGIWIALHDSYVWFQHQSPPRGFFLTVIGILVVLIGYNLFLFRLHARFIFGLTEAIAGLVIALRNVPADADPVLWSSEIFLVILTAGIFLVVRGFDNMHTGVRSEPRDAVLKAFHETEYGALWRSLNGGGQ